MAHPEQLQSPDAWSRLWAAGVLHSCVTGMHGNYDGAILAFWQRQFESLADGACVVDLGTGNGALLLLARDVARARGVSFDLHGVDLADIDPVRHVGDGVRDYSSICFHPRTSADALPFGAGQVSMICAQFGFEYAPRDSTLAEILRVLSANGRIAMILHSDDSVVAQTAPIQREALAFMRDQCPVIERARALVPVLHRAAQAGGSAGLQLDPNAGAIRHAYNDAVQALITAIEREPRAQVLKNAAMQLRQALQLAAHSPQQADDLLHRIEHALQDEDARLEHLQAALLSVDDLTQLADTLGAHGFKVRHAGIEQHGVKMGWALEAWHE